MRSDGEWLERGTTIEWRDPKPLVGNISISVIVLLGGSGRRRCDAAQLI